MGLITVEEYYAEVMHGQWVTTEGSIVWNLDSSVDCSNLEKMHVKHEPVTKIYENLVCKKPTNYHNWYI